MWGNVYRSLHTFHVTCSFDFMHGNYIFFIKIWQKVTVQEGHATYEQLENLTLPLWKSFYFFNLTNREDFEAGSKPILEEVGPYSYRCVNTNSYIFGIFNKCSCSNS